MAPEFGQATDSTEEAEWHEPDNDMCDAYVFMDLGLNPDLFRLFRAEKLVSRTFRGSLIVKMWLTKICEL